MTKEDPSVWYEKGQWRSFDRVLAWINTQEALYISKKELYKVVVEMRPTPYQEYKDFLESLDFK